MRTRRAFAHKSEREPRVELIGDLSKRSEMDYGDRVALRELEGLLRQLAHVNRQILMVRRAITGLAATLGDDGVDGSVAVQATRVRRTRREDLTRACRTVLDHASLPLTAREVTHAVRELSPSAIADQANPVASVTAILRRLLEFGEVNNAFNEEGRRTWFATRKRL